MAVGTRHLEVAMVRCQPAVNDLRDLDAAVKARGVSSPRYPAWHSTAENSSVMSLAIRTCGKALVGVHKSDTVGVRIPLPHHQFESVVKGSLKYSTCWILRSGTEGSGTRTYRHSGCWQPQRSSICWPDSLQYSLQYFP
jgi:hypothetical protein